jgi:hypothetical protein
MKIKPNKRKKAQMLSRKSGQVALKRGQEEIAGFAIILVLVGVIILIFLAFTIKPKATENVKDYQITSFIQSFLQVTTLCEQNGDNLSVQELLSECRKEADCSYGMESCIVLNNTLSGILAGSWEPVGEDLPIKGYKLNITSEGERMIFLKKGGVTLESKGSSQLLPEDINIFFDVYYQTS